VSDSQAVVHKSSSNSNVRADADDDDPS
jgi:hypothetical protein